MLKKISGLFLGLVVLAGSACVTPTHASSAFNVSQVLLTRIQPAGPGGAKEESVVIHNNSDQDIDITNWCLTNKSDVEFICFTVPVDEHFRYILLSHASVAAVSQEYAASHFNLSEDDTFVYPVTNQSSGSLVGSADTISLRDATGAVVDSKSWSTSIANTQMHSRIQMVYSPPTYANTDSPADWSIEMANELPDSGLVRYVLPPSGPTEDPDEPPAVDDLADSRISITELLPNPSGSDAGEEFIELYNDGDEVVSLEKYSLQFRATNPKTYIFPFGSTVASHSYITFSDTQTGMTLTNTAGVIQLLYNGEPIGESIEYSNAKDDQSWALIDGVWQYTKEPTPGLPNQLPIILDSTPQEETPSQKPCASNQYRSEETGRCRLLASTVPTPTPCKEGQERNPQTNRCRSISTTTATLAACKEGQERNPETNRCRAVAKMSTADFGVKGVQSEEVQIQWYVWLGGIAAIGAVATYIVWEWRVELSSFCKSLYRKFAHRRD
jgi:hypothetical protein